MFRFQVFERATGVFVRAAILIYVGPGGVTGAMSIIGVTPSLDETSFYVYGA